MIATLIRQFTAQSCCDMTIYRLAVYISLIRENFHLVLMQLLNCFQLTPYCVDHQSVCKNTCRKLYQEREFRCEASKQQPSDSLQCFVADRKILRPRWRSQQLKCQSWVQCGEGPNIWAGHWCWRQHCHSDWPLLCLTNLCDCDCRQWEWGDFRQIPLQFTH